MKPSKYSLLRGNESQRPIYASDQFYEEPHRHTSTHEDIPYSQFEQKPNLPPQGSNIQMKPMRQSSSSNVAPSNSNYQKIQTQNRSFLNTSQPQYQQHPPQQFRSCMPTHNQFRSQVGPQASQTNFHSVVYPGYPPNSRPNQQYASQFSPVQIQPQAQPFIPPVTASCSFCQCKQRIPGDTDQFYCGSCQEINKTEPRFGLFICGSCRQKVSYPYRTSDHITCNHCFTINKVAPFPPNARKSKVQLDSLNESSMVLPRQLRQNQQEKGLKQREYPNMRKESKEDYSKIRKQSREEEEEIVERQ